MPSPNETLPPLAMYTSLLPRFYPNADAIPRLQRRIDEMRMTLLSEDTRENRARLKALLGRMKELRREASHG